MIKLDRNMSGWINQTILSHLIDLNFKPKYDKCDGPEMNTIKNVPLSSFYSFSNLSSITMKFTRPRRVLHSILQIDYRLEVFWDLTPCSLMWVYYYHSPVLAYTLFIICTHIHTQYRPTQQSWHPYTTTTNITPISNNQMRCSWMDNFINF
jgi:hypothetical protein